MRDPATSPALLRVERDMHVSGLKYALEWPPQGAVELWLSFPGITGATGIGFLPDAGEEYETYHVADQMQEYVLDSLRVRGRARTWPRAVIGGAPLWAAMHDGVAVWESVDGSERHRIGELPEGR
ncbi:hypothetical protein [Tsukamurella sp. 1534]|uniref:hypothetical protein n=1 Tax=Tsukamurella sp. 1534 TaxID=1151061 RepID=UPI0002DA171F|nr:hypothetical protein [Tsukamurella sp. 1534]